MNKITWKLLVLVFCCSALQAQEINQWRIIKSQVPVPEKGYRFLSGYKFHWLPKQKKVFTSPYFWGSEADVRLFDMNAKTWSVSKGMILEKDATADRWNSPLASCYLPGLDRVFFLREERIYSKTTISGWLLDVEKKELSGIKSDVSFGDQSKDFELQKGRDGLRMSIWGAMVYDPINKEAVAFGGGGIWGRVGKTSIPLNVGEWFYDESLKRVRYVTPKDKKNNIKGRRWFAGHSGTWRFSEATKKWSVNPQPLHLQPEARITPSMVYASSEQKIYMFGGDTLAKCLDDFWAYDCKTKIWSQIKTDIHPSARGFAGMVYDKRNDALVLIGGYGPGWYPLGDVWVFQLKTKKWFCLGTNLKTSKHKKGVITGVGLPLMGYQTTAVINPDSGIILVSSSVNKQAYNRKTWMLEIRLDISKLSSLTNKTKERSNYHCRSYPNSKTDLPGEWLKGIGAPEKKEAVLAKIKSFPANTWKAMNPTKRVPARVWGSSVYDIRTHKGFAWGGGHSAYPGAEYSVYNLEINRWDGMKQPTNYNPLWLFGMVNGPPGMSFSGWSLLPSHARKSYGVDPLSNTVVAFSGDVFSIEEQAVTMHIGDFPVKWSGPSAQVAFVTTPHGLYGYASDKHTKKPGCLARANVKMGKWDVIAQGGPKRHDEHDFLVYDSKRDVVRHFKSKGSVVNVFSFKSKTWSVEKCAGESPPFVLGDATYIPEMDSIFMIFKPDKKKYFEQLYFYHCGKKEWSIAPSKGDKFFKQKMNRAGRDCSPIYDPTYKMILRFSGKNYKHIGVMAMRIEPKSFLLSPYKATAQPTK